MRAISALVRVSLAVSTIDHGLPLARGALGKRAIKQVDRLLSNPRIDIKGLLSRWVSSIVGVRENIEVAMGWTDFAKVACTTSSFRLSTMLDCGRSWKSSASSCLISRSLSIFMG
jgi:hypothetical protein